MYKRFEQPRSNKEINLLLLLFYSALYDPYETCPIGLSSSIPGAIRFVLGSPVALEAEQRAIVGELEKSQFKFIRAGYVGDSPSRNNICEIEIVNNLLQRLSSGLGALVLVHKLDLAQ